MCYNFRIKQDKLHILFVIFVIHKVIDFFQYNITYTTRQIFFCYPFIRISCLEPVIIHKEKLFKQFELLLTYTIRFR